MAEILTALPARKRGRPAKYPWPLWLDGQPRRLERGRDFPTTVRDAYVFRMMAYNAGKRQKPPVKVNAYVVDENTIDIRAWSPDDTT